MAVIKTKYPTRPSLVGAKIHLRPATADDEINIEYWTLQSEPEALSCHALPFLTPSEAAERRKNKEKSTDEQRFAVVRNSDQMLVGAVTFFNYNSLNRSAELGLLIDPEERKKGYGKQAIQLISRYLFRFRGLNKVYAQTAEFNDAAVKLLEKLDFKRDGTLRDHYFYDGEFYAAVIYSLLLFEMQW